MKNVNHNHHSLFIVHCSLFTARRAFTLVELLVTITIIALLAGLLIPAVSSAREAGRRAQCINRMREVGTALQTYEKENKGLPGYVTKLGTYTGGTTLAGNTITNGTQRTLSWVASILAELNDPKRFEILTKDAPSQAELALAVGNETNLPVLLCPSARKETFDNHPSLSFVVNCGPTDTNAANAAVIGSTVSKFSLFTDRRVNSINKKVKLEEIKDGTSNTILLTENLQAFTWYEPNSCTWDDANYMGATSATDTIKTRHLTQIGSFGFMWRNLTDISAAQTETTPTQPIVRINGYRAWPQPTSFGAVNVFFARPSSHHPGIVNMLYADNTVKSMHEDIGLGPYLTAVCPDDTAAVLATGNGGLGYEANDFFRDTWKEPR